MPGAKVAETLSKFPYRADMKVSNSSTGIETTG